MATRGPENQPGARGTGRVVAAAIDARRAVSNLRRTTLPSIDALRAWAALYRRREVPARN